MQDFIAGPSAEPIGDGAAITRAAGDVALLLERVSGELAGLSHSVAELQTGLGGAIAAAAAHDPLVVLRAQQLDLVAQSLDVLDRR